MQARPKISYAICVKDEVDSFVKLIDFLLKHKKQDDEIVVISDYSTSPLVKNYINKVDKFVFKKLMFDFASHKNIFFSLCRNEYIFNLDADELPSDRLISDIHTIISERNVDLIWLPRLNLFNGYSEQEIKNFGWNVDKSKNNAINFPDYQGRVYKNCNELRWKNKLHEQIKGARIVKKLKYNEGYYLTHIKTKSAQDKSNYLYNNLLNFNPDVKSLGIVCCYFNPCNYKSKFLNFVKFINGLHSSGLNPLVVETYSNTSLYRVNNLTNNIISIETKSIFWKKEQLLNIGIKNLLKQNYKYIAWVDADIIFRNKDWWKSVIIATEFYGVIQIFSHSYKENVTTDAFANSSAYELCGVDKTLDLKNILQRKTEPGYGHCYHRSFLEKNLLYDLSIIGTGDLLNLIGFYYSENTHDIIMNDRFFRGMSTEFKNSYIKWCNQNKKLKHGVGYANVEITTMYHGNKKDRRYVTRENILRDNNYNPYTDLNKRNQIYEIQNQTIRRDIINHFYNRNEDNNISFSDDIIIDKINNQDRSYDLEFSQNEIYKMVNTQTEKNKISEFEITDNEEMLIAVRTNEKLLSVNRIELKCKLLVDAKTKPCINSFSAFQSHGPFGVLLEFICEFYHKLPNVIYFTQNNSTPFIKDNFARIKLEANKNFYPIVGKIKPIGYGMHTKIKNYKSLWVWYKENINDTYSEQNKMFIGNSFAIIKKSIHKRPVQFYVSLLARYKINPTNEEHLLKIAIYDLLK